ncbi:622_t:CDS:2, partial [Cetraspora pellucida]
KELDWANKVENIIKTKKVLKLPLLSKGKDNKETCVNLVQDQPIIETQSTNQSVFDIVATPAQKKLQVNSQTKKWSELFSKFKEEKATFTNSIPKPKK